MSQPRHDLHWFSVSAATRARPSCPRSNGWLKPSANYQNHLRVHGDDRQRRSVDGKPRPFESLLKKATCTNNVQLIPSRTPENKPVVRQDSRQS
jgi:hypothetical protein